MVTESLGTKSNDWILANNKKVKYSMNKQHILDTNAGKQLS